MCFSAFGTFAQEAFKARENTEWADVWITSATDHKLPKVLLIGNSITAGYYPGVVKLLEGKANVSKIATSQFLSDPMLLSTLANVLDNFKFDVIHFNNGMHGWQYSEDDYRKAFDHYVKVIRKHAPQAKLIWGNTTPIKVSPMSNISNERITLRNAIGLKKIEGKGIAVDDLYTPMLGHPEYHSDNIHFNEAAKVIQAAQVAGIIGEFLPEKK